MPVTIALNIWSIIASLDLARSLREMEILLLDTSTIRVHICFKSFMLLVHHISLAIDHAETNH